MTIANTYDVFGNLVKEVEWTSGTGTVTTEHVYSGSTLAHGPDQQQRHPDSLPGGNGRQ